MIKIIANNMTDALAEFSRYRSYRPFKCVGIKYVTHKKDCFCFYVTKPKVTDEFFKIN